MIYARRVLATGIACGLVGAGAGLWTYLKTSTPPAIPEIERDPSSQVLRAPTIDEVRSLVLSEKINTISGLLARLSTRYPDYLRFYSLAFDSLSLHKASFENPRAIVYGPAGNFIITFNGSQSQAGYSKLEVEAFNKSNGPQFQEWIFLGEPGATVDLEDQDIDVRTDNVVISKFNISRCTACHGVPTRPIFQPYPMWPGFYGGDDDSLFEANNESARFFRIPPDYEEEGYKKYLANRNRSGRPHPRYRHLPERRRSSVHGGNYVKYPQTETDILDPGLCWLRPNICLNRTLADQMSQMLVQKIKSLPNAERNLTFIAGLFCLEERRDRGSGTIALAQDGEPIQNGIFEREFRELLSRYDQSLVARFEQKQAQFIAQAETDLNQLLTEDVTRMDILAEGRLDHAATPASERRRDFGPSGRRKFIEQFLEPGEAGKYTSLESKIAGILALWDISIQDFSIELRRSNVYDDGFGPFSTLGFRTRQELQQIKRLPTLPSCETILQ